MISIQWRNFISFRDSTIRIFDLPSRNCIFSSLVLELHRFPGLTRIQLNWSHYFGYYITPLKTIVVGQGSHIGGRKSLHKKTKYQLLQGWWIQLKRPKRPRRSAHMFLLQSGRKRRIPTIGISIAFTYQVRS